MYPKYFIDHFRKFDKSDTVFVAMPFATEFDGVWRKVYEPAIDNCGLKAHRVDTTLISDSILTEIIEGVSQSRLVLVDISVDSNKVRNANVMYELGIAQSSRLPEEVIVVRTDHEDRLPFDVTHIRAHGLWGSEEENKKQLTDLINASLSSLDKTKDLLLQKTFRSLDRDCIYFMAMEKDNDYVKASSAQNGSYGYLKWAEIRVIVRRLIELEVLELTETPSDKKKAYKWSELGIALFDKHNDIIESIKC